MVAPLDGLKLQVRRREDGGVVVLHMKCGGCRIVVMALRGGCCYSSFLASCGGAKLDGDALVARARGEDELAVVSGLAMRMCCGEGAAGALQVKVARRRKMVVVEARGCCCFRRVSVVAGEEMAAAAMVGGRKIRIRVSCVRWRR
ncbi:hypothetical protein DEO72_LG5g1115 [Vigna unguiculata]|uniref:Uncharacterized protein n=1 Tax=Vigna unguiculata TaxID=3917 RepID=A0A4D6LYV5_VIGUN|nr:hypothetical protein DEO72_LG5g1115 [Vigna unguiculata]